MDVREYEFRSNAKSGLRVRVGRGNDPAVEHGERGQVVFVACLVYDFDRTFMKDDRVAIMTWTRCSADSIKHDSNSLRPMHPSHQPSTSDLRHQPEGSASGAHIVKRMLDEEAGGCTFAKQVTAKVLASG